MRAGIGWAGTVLLAAIALTLGTLAAAQSDQDGERAIAVAARHPMFATGLVNRPGWTASTYHAEELYGLWRVDFFSADGAELGWAQVLLEEERLLSWQTWFGLADADFAEAQETLLDFLRYDSTFLAFAGDVDDIDWSWVGYDDWRDTWTVSLERGSQSLVVTLRSANEWQRSLEDLRIVSIEVPALVPEADWRSRRGAEAAALAFTDARVAGAVRGLDGWVSEAEQLDDTVWLVRFNWEGQTVVEAEVDLRSTSVSVR